MKAADEVFVALNHGYNLADDARAMVTMQAAEAQARATLAVAEAIDRLTEQQRLANVIDYHRASWDGASPLAPVLEDVEKGLGL